MTSFCLKQGQDLKASDAHLYPHVPQVTPPPLPQGLHVATVIFTSPNPLRLSHRFEILYIQILMPGTNFLSTCIDFAVGSLLHCTTPSNLKLVSLLKSLM